MIKKDEIILTYKKAILQILLQVNGIICFLCIFLFLLNLITHNYFGCILAFISSCYLFYSNYKLIKNIIPKFNRIFFHSTYQIYIITLFLLFYFVPFNIISTCEFFIGTFLYGFILQNIFLNKIKNSKFEELFSKEQIKNIENL